MCRSTQDGAVMFSLISERWLVMYLTQTCLLGRDLSFQSDGDDMDVMTGHVADQIFFFFFLVSFLWASLSQMIDVPFI